MSAGGKDDTLGIDTVAYEYLNSMLILDSINIRIKLVFCCFVGTRLMLYGRVVIYVTLFYSDLETAKTSVFIEVLRLDDQLIMCI